jgi:hypothetical protein
MMAFVQEPAWPVHDPAMNGIGDRLHGDHRGKEDQNAKCPVHSAHIEADAIKPKRRWR